MKQGLQERLEALGYKPCFIRTTLCLPSPTSEYVVQPVHDIIGGVPINYTRRRYGTTTFTWVNAYSKIAGWNELRCDPWPCVTPKRSEVEREIQLAQAMA